MPWCAPPHSGEGSASSAERSDGAGPRLRPFQEGCYPRLFYAKDDEAAWLLVVAAPSFARPQESAGGAAVPAVGMTQAGPGAWSLDGGKLMLRPHYVLRFSSLLMVRDAVTAGAGAGLLPQSLVAHHLDDGRLVAWGEADGRAVELWVLHTSRRLTSPKVQAFVEFICSQYAGGELRL